MFKSAATRIAHNTTIPALAGQSDLRPLQDLITAEKTVLTTMQTLRMDLAKAVDALRIWGQAEDDDLGDILTASATILMHFATALSTYSSVHHTIRDSMKSVRTREEALEDLRRRRRRVGTSAEATEKKLNKMNPEHKNYGVQTDALNKLRDEMRTADEDIAREEKELGVYKRKCTREWMSFKFGGLVECCEKGVIAGNIGRRVIQFISEDVTQSGLPRAYYNAQSRVGDLVSEAQQAVSQVTRNATGHIPISASISQSPVSASQKLPTQSSLLRAHSLIGLTSGVSPPPGPPHNRHASVNEFGLYAPMAHTAQQFSSLPTNMERDVVSASSIGPASLLSPPPYDRSSGLDPSAGPVLPPSLSVPCDSSGFEQRKQEEALLRQSSQLSRQPRKDMQRDAVPLSSVGPARPLSLYTPYDSTEPEKSEETVQRSQLSRQPRKDMQHDAVSLSSAGPARPLSHYMPYDGTGPERPEFSRQPRKDMQRDALLSSSFGPTPYDSSSGPERPEPGKAVQQWSNQLSGQPRKVTRPL